MVGTLEDLKEEEQALLVLLEYLPKAQLGLIDDCSDKLIDIRGHIERLEKEKTL